MSNSLSDAKVLLQKIQLLIDNLDISKQQSAIEIDLIKDHLRRLYDITLHLKVDKADESTSKIPEPVIVPKIESLALPPETIRMEESPVEELPRIIFSPLESNVHVEEVTHPEENHLHETKNFLNEKLATEKEILADKIKPQKTNDLRTAIDLNEKYLFINELFKSDTLAYEKAIRFLNGLTNMQDAKVYVEKELAINYSWQNKPVAMHKFLESIKVKFQE